MQLPVSKDRTITGAFHKNVVLKKLKAHFKRCHHKTGHEYLRLLHGGAHAHKAGIVTKFLESEKVNVLPHPLFHLTWLPVIISCFQTSTSICLEKDVSQEILLSLLYISSLWVCLFSTLTGAFKIGLTA